MTALMVVARSFEPRIGIEANETGVGGEQGDRHSGGEGEVGGVGVALETEERAGRAEGNHAECDGGEGAAEEAHRGAGEVGEVAEREVVEGAVVGEEVGQGGAGRVGRSEDGEVTADESDHCGKRGEKPE